MKSLKVVVLIMVATMSVGIAQASSKAVFAGGCFWCMEKPFEQIKGVSTVISGYVGGEASTANYEDVSSGKTKHREAVEITYNESQVSFEELLNVFWQNIDPVDAKGQFCDKGFQYTTAIIAQTPDQKTQAEKSKHELSAKKGTLATVVTDKQTFYPAETYHQNYYKTHSLKYNFYRQACGRDKRLKDFWQK